MKNMRRKGVAAKKIEPYKVIIAFATVVILLVAMYAAMVAGIKNRNSKMVNVREDITDEVYTSTKEFLSSYNYVTGENEVVGIEKEVTECVAQEAALSTAKNISTSKINQNTVSDINNAVKKAVDTKFKEYAVALSQTDQDELTAGVQALALTSTYKAISDRGLVDVNSLNTLRDGLEKRMSAIEASTDERLNSVTSTLTKIQTVFDTNTINATISDADLRSIKNDIERGVSKQVDNQLKGIVSANVDEKIGESIGEAVEKQVGLAVDEKIDSKMSELEKRIGNSDALNSKIAAQTDKINSLSSSFEATSSDLAGQILALKASQNNTASLIQTLSEQVSDAKIDARITELCNELAESLGADIDAKNTALLSKINLLSSDIDATNSSLNLLSGVVTTQVGEIKVSIKDLEDSQADKLSKTAQSLQEKINSSNVELDSSIKNTASILQALIDGNSQDIDSLLSSLEGAKSSLTSAIETADAENKGKIEEMLSDVNSLIEGVNSSFANEIKLVRADISNLSKEQSDALRTAADTLNERINSSNTDISALKTANDALNGLIDGNTTNIATLAASLSSAKAELERALASSNDSNAEDKKALQDNIDAVDSVLSELKGDYGSRITTIETDVKTMYTRISALGGELEETNKSLNLLSLAMDSKVSEIKVSIKDLEDSQADKLSKTAQSLQEKINSSNVELDSSIKNTASLLQALIDGNSQDIDSLLTSLEGAKSSLTSAIETADAENKGKIEEMLSDVNSLIEGVNSSFSNEIKLVRADISDLSKAQSEALKQASDTLNEKINLSATDISSLKDARDTLNGLVNGNTTNIAALTASLSAAKSELEAALLDSSNDSADKRKALQDNIDAVDGVLTELKADYGSRITSIESDVKTINMKLGTLGSQLDETSKSLNLLSLAMDSKVSEIRVSIKDLEDSQADKLSKTAQSLQEKINSSNTELDSSIKNTASLLQALIDGNSQDIDSLLESLEGAKTSLTSAIETADAENKGKIEEMLSDVNSLIEGVNSSFANEIKLVRADITSLSKAQSDALKEASDTLNERIDSSDSDISTLKAARDTLNGLVNGNTTNIAALTASLSAAKSELEKALLDSSNDSADKRKALQDNIDAVDGVLTELKADYGSRIGTIEEDVRTIRSSLSAQAESMKTLSNLLDNTKTQLTEAKNTLTTSLSELATTAAATATKADKNEEDIATLSSNKADKSDVTKNSSDISSLQSGKADKSEVSDIADNVSGIAGDVSSLQSGKADKSTVDSLSSAVDSNTDDVEALKARIAELEAELEKKATVEFYTDEDGSPVVRLGVGNLEVDEGISADDKH